MGEGGGGVEGGGGGGVEPKDFVEGRGEVMMQICYGNLKRVGDITCTNNPVAGNVWVVGRDVKRRRQRSEDGA
jgi:hypothetical protein